ncbi:MAG: hypothetical protein J7L04_12015 [Bacteroidales bacterium]|nr:hypothetical protein [Bacteroidales bacterium]
MENREQGRRNKAEGTRQKAEGTRQKAEGTRKTKNKDHEKGDGRQREFEENSCQRYPLGKVLTGKC